MAKLNWGILATGRIASIFAKGVLASQLGNLAAVASRSPEEAAAFGITKHGDFLQNHPLTRHPSYEALLADPNVHAVYIATPHTSHAFWAIRALEAGKHVLCEKPIGLNHAEAMTIFETARRHNRFAMEAFMYRCHPQIATLLDLIRSNAIGQVRHIQANFAFNAGPNYESRLLKNSLGGGGILDVGCYTVSAARLIAGAAFGLHAPAEPKEFKAVGHIGPTGVDEYTAAVLKFSHAGHDITANLATGVEVNMDNTVRVYGSEGSIQMFNWVPKDVGNKLLLHQKGKEPQEIPCDAHENVYALEADAAASAIARGDLQPAYPAMTWPDTLGNMKTLDAWRRDIGQIYDSEKPANLTTPISGRPLARRPDSPMTYLQLPGVTLPVSRLVMGVDNQSIEAMPHASAIFDDYFERGGNAFDSAYIYGAGRCEKALGQWIKNRNLRAQVVILDKGAHTPDCNPDALSRQLLVSLERLQTDYLDIYMLHRDNPDVPVAEFVDALNEILRAGRIRSFGVSNWTIERIDAFNAYARQHNLAPISAVSNNFSLARMVKPVWAGCIAASEPACQAWHTQTQMPLMPWSSQAHGFFVVGNPANTADKSLVESWYSEDNFRRLARARELAAKLHVLPIQIALAYVLHQPFPTLPLIGPRQIEETRTSFDALRITLTPADLRYLNLES